MDEKIQIDGWEIGTGDEKNAQMHNGLWFYPTHGCDSLQLAIEGMILKDRQERKSSSK